MNKRVENKYIGDVRSMPMDEREAYMQERDARIVKRYVELRGTKNRAVAVAMEFDCNASYVKRIVSRSGAKMDGRRFTPRRTMEERTAARKLAVIMRERGYTATEIASEVGMSETWVRNCLAGNVGLVAVDIDWWLTRP